MPASNAFPPFQHVLFTGASSLSALSLPKRKHKAKANNTVKRHKAQLCVGRESDDESTPAFAQEVVFLIHPNNQSLITFYFFFKYAQITNH